MIERQNSGSGGGGEWMAPPEVNYCPSPSITSSDASNSVPFKVRIEKVRMEKPGWKDTEDSGDCLSEWEHHNFHNCHLHPHCHLYHHCHSCHRCHVFIIVIMKVLVVSIVHYHYYHHQHHHIDITY